MKRLLMISFLVLFMISFQYCSKTKAGSGGAEMKAGIYPTCNSSINFDSKGDNVDYVIYSDHLNFSASANNDELGLNIYILGGQTLQTGTFDLNSVSPLGFTLYWDPGDDAIDEYGHISGQITINSFKFDNGYTNNYNHLTEMDFSFNGTVENHNGDMVCISNGSYHWEQ